MSQVAAPSLRDQAYLQLHEMLLSEELEPGTMVSERKLAARLGMSKTPVRGALERLVWEGFVTVSPQQGILVREMGVQEIVENFDLRQAIEPFVIKSVAGNLTPEQILQLRENVEAQKEMFADDVSRAMVELDCEFHLMFCRFLGNEEIIRVMTQLRDKIHRVIYRVHQKNSLRRLAGTAEHEDIAASVIRGDGDAAAQLMVTHLEEGKKSLFS